MLGLIFSPLLAEKLGLASMGLSIHEATGSLEQLDHWNIRMTGKTATDIAKDIRNFLEENYLLSEDSQEVGDETSLLDEGIIDSTGVLELITFLEDQFGITVEDDEILPENLDSVKKITVYVERKK
jgi:acyl carrier protein